MKIMCCLSVFIFSYSAFAKANECTALFSNNSSKKNIIIPGRQEITQRSKIKIVNDKIKVAFFDADDTLRTSTKKNPSSNTKEEVQILEGRAQKLKELSEEGYLIAIVSNQGGIPRYYSLEDATEVFRYTIQLLTEQGGVINYFDFAENYDHYRKPNPGMYERLEQQVQTQFGSAITIDKDQSFMVGDGAYSKDDIRPDGRPGTNFSNSDRLFAENLDLEFFEAELFFTNRHDTESRIANSSKSKQEASKIKRNSKKILTKKLALPGAILEVREVTKNILREAGNSLEIHLDENTALDIGHVIDKTTGNLYVKHGDLLEILEGPTISNRINSALVKDLRTGLVGIVWWAELKWSTYLVSPGRPIPTPIEKKPSYLKFPDSQKPVAMEIGRTRYDRPLAQVGDLVWIGNLSRRMSPTNLGRVIEIIEESTAGMYSEFPDMIIELVNNSRVEKDGSNVNPLTSEEVIQVRAFFGDKIQADWFK